uniref:Follicle stimulating hormone beta subunit n=1 Tax=Rachycentron canadum TaxID=141264 RepID=A0A191Y1Y9_RACCA|nr:follicle stimulating hormone beta subunit [Rachycentron canadum]
MQLVVMAAVLAMAGAGQGCSFDCRLTSVNISVEGCAGPESVHTTICAGQCYHEDPVYISDYDWTEQRTCNGDWSYEVKHIPGCPVGVTYPVARNCKCAVCNKEHMFCGRFLEDIPSCPSF